MFTRVAALLVFTFAPVVAQAQSAWDVTGIAGLLSGYTPRSDGTRYQESWFQNAQGGVIIGRHLTPHLKVEVEATTTTKGNQYRDRSVAVPGYPYPYPIVSEVSTSVRSLAGAVTWQFRNNEWVHPFVQAGIAADFDRLTVRTWEQFFYGTRQPGAPPERIVEEHIEGPTTSRKLRAVLGGGAKVYFNERGFVRSDARWSFDRDRHNLALRVGVGIDF